MDIDIFGPAMGGIAEGLRTFVQALPWWMWLLPPAALLLGALPARRRRR